MSESERWLTQALQPWPTERRSKLHIGFRATHPALRQSLQERRVSGSNADLTVQSTKIRSRVAWFQCQRSGNALNLDVKLVVCTFF